MSQFPYILTPCRPVRCGEPRYLEVSDTGFGRDETTRQDSQILCKSLRDALKSEGHTVVIMTDLGLPRVGRPENGGSDQECVLPKMPIILLTAWGQSLSIKGDAPPHVGRVLSKPPNFLQLRRALAELTAHGVEAGPSGV